MSNRDIDQIGYSEIWDRIDSWDNYHRDLVVWLFNSSSTDLTLTEWAEQFARFEIAREINRENKIWDQPQSAVVINLSDYRVRRNLI